MVKKKVKKRVSKKSAKTPVRQADTIKNTPVTAKKKNQSEKLNQILVENFTNLQRVITNLSIRFDELSYHIARLLRLFEETGRNFASQYPSGNVERDKDFIEKLDRLLDQNKTIAKGLTLMEGKLRENVYGTHLKSPIPAQKPGQFNLNPSIANVPQRQPPVKKPNVGYGFKVGFPVKKQEPKENK